MRLQKTLLNYVATLFPTILLMFFGLYRSRLLVNSLGLDMAGLEATFGDVFAFIHLAEAGLGTAVLTALYKPVSEKQYYKVSQLVTGARFYMRKIAMYILGMGIIASIFIPLLIKDSSLSYTYIYVAYFVFLTKSVIGYFLYVPGCIISAHQEDYKAQVFYTLFSIVTISLEILLLKIGFEVISIALLGMILTIIQNITMNIVIKKMYPQFLWVSRKEMDLSPKEKTKDLFVHKIATLVLYNTDKLVAASFIGLSSATIYNIYNNLFQRLWSFISPMLYSSTSSLGNYYASESKENKLRILNEQADMTFYIAAVILVPAFVVAEPFIGIWYNTYSSEVLQGNLFLFGFIILNYYSITRVAISLGLELHGIFKETKISALFEAGINITASIILVNILPENYKLLGILLGTLLSFLCTNFWFYPRVLYKEVFGTGAKKYYVKYMINFCLFLFLCFSMKVVANLIIPEYGTTFASLIPLSLVGGLIFILNFTILSIVFYKFSAGFRMFVFRIWVLIKKILKRG